MWMHYSTSHHNNSLKYTSHLDSNSVQITQLHFSFSIHKPNRNIPRLRNITRHTTPPLDCNSSHIYSSNPSTSIHAISEQNIPPLDFDSDQIMPSKAIPRLLSTPLRSIPFLDFNPTHITQFNSTSRLHPKTYHSIARHSTSRLHSNSMIITQLHLSTSTSSMSATVALSTAFLWIKEVSTFRTTFIISLTNSRSLLHSSSFTQFIQNN